MSARSEQEQREHECEEQERAGAQEQEEQGAQVRSGEHKREEQGAARCARNRGYYDVSSCALSSRASSTPHGTNIVRYYSKLS